MVHWFIDRVAYWLPCWRVSVAERVSVSDWQPLSTELHSHWNRETSFFAGLYAGSVLVLVMVQVQDQEFLLSHGDDPGVDVFLFSLHQLDIIQDLVNIVCRYLHFLLTHSWHLNQSQQRHNVTMETRTDRCTRIQAQVALKSLGYAECLIYGPDCLSFEQKSAEKTSSTF